MSYAILLACVAIVLARAETLDRIAVTVGRHVITESDVVLDLRVAAFLDGRTPDFSGAQRRSAAARLVDLYFVLQDAAVSRAPEPTPADVDALMEPVRARYGSDADYRAALERAGISENDVREHLFAGLRMMRYTELRFRPEVQITEQDLHRAFDALSAKQPAGSPAPGFEANRAKLEELVMNQRILEALDRWLALMRSETPILYRDAAFR